MGTVSGEATLPFLLFGALVGGVLSYMEEYVPLGGLSFIFEEQGPVVQSIVSLTSPLRGQLVKCFTTF